jgi:hypothetical protein
VAAKLIQKTAFAQSVKTTDFVTLTVTHFVNQPLWVTLSFAFWN